MPGDDIAGSFRTIGEMVEAACNNLDRKQQDYLLGGAESETTLARNRQALDSLAFRPRVMRDVSIVDPSASIFGQMSPLPLFLAPVGRMDHFHKNAALEPALAAARYGVPSMLSSVTQPSPADMRAVCSGHQYFQLYVRDGIESVLKVIDEVTELGFSAFCLTVDSDVYGRRERDRINGFDPRPSSESELDEYLFQAQLSWTDLERIKSHCSLPLILKGIATAEDTRLAIDHGVDAVYVSNHGGRQLDHGVGAIDVLPEVVAEADGKVPVFVDGGFCRGSDVIKALALGASAVGLGKIYVACLAAGGETAVFRMLELFEEEIRGVMALLGVSSLSDLGSEYLRTSAPVREADFKSPFPTLS